MEVEICWFKKTQKNYDFYGFLYFKACKWFWSISKLRGALRRNKYILSSTDYCISLLLQKINLCLWLQFSIRTAETFFPWKWCYCTSHWTNTMLVFSESILTNFTKNAVLFLFFWENCKKHLLVNFLKDKKWFWVKMILKPYCIFLLRFNILTMCLGIKYGMVSLLMALLTYASRQDVII